MIIIIISHYLYAHGRIFYNINFVNYEFFNSVKIEFLGKNPDVNQYRTVVRNGLATLPIRYSYST